MPTSASSGSCGRSCSTTSRAGLTFVVELTTPTGRGVTVIEHGRQIATFAESHPALGARISSMTLPPEAWGPYASSSIGARTRRRIPGSRRSLPPTVVALTVAAAFSATPPREDDASRIDRPIVVPDDDPNATLSALFGPHQRRVDTSCRRQRSRRAPGPTPTPGRRPAAAVEAARTESPSALVRVRRGSRG